MHICRVEGQTPVLIGPRRFDQHAVDHLVILHAGLFNERDRYAELVSDLIDHLAGKASGTGRTGEQIEEQSYVEHVHVPVEVQVGEVARSVPTPPRARAFQATGTQQDPVVVKVRCFIAVEVSVWPGFTRVIDPILGIEIPEAWGGDTRAPQGHAANFVHVRAVAVA